MKIMPVNTNYSNQNRNNQPTFKAVVVPLDITIGKLFFRKMSTLRFLAELKSSCKRESKFFRPSIGINEHNQIIGIIQVLTKVQKQEAIKKTSLEHVLEVERREENRILKEYKNAYSVSDETAEQYRGNVNSETLTKAVNNGIAGF